MEKSILTKKEVMNLLSIHRNTFDKWVKINKLPLIQIGKRKWVRRTDLDGWLVEHSINSVTVSEEQQSEEIQWKSIWGKK